MCNDATDRKAVRIIDEIAAAIADFHPDAPTKRGKPATLLHVFKQLAIDKRCSTP